jgi:hypothetical protein
MKIKYVLRTHFFNDFIDFQWNKLINDIGIEDCYLMMDDTYLKKPYHDIFSRLNQQIENCHIIYINYNECCQINKLHKDNKGQVESQLFILYKIIKDFDYLYLIEYDVYCDGNWKLTLTTNQNEDFLATHVDDFNLKNITWGHWFNLKGSKKLKPERKDRVKSFFPITRYSIHFFKMLEKKIGIYTGFCEVYIPSLVKQNNLTYNNFNENILGKHWIFTDEQKENFKPILENNNKLFHPVISILSNI